MVVDRDEPFTSSKVAAGLVTPISGRQFALAPGLEATPPKCSKNVLGNRGGDHYIASVLIITGERFAFSVERGRAGEVGKERCRQSGIHRSVYAELSLRTPGV